MKLYSGTDINTFLEQERRKISNEIAKQNDDYILNVNVDDFAAHLVSHHELDIPKILTQDATLDILEKEIYGRQFPREFFLEDNQLYKVDVYQYYVPYSGDVDLLKLKPNPRFLGGNYEFSHDNSQQCFIIEVHDFYKRPDYIDQNYGQKVGDLISNYQNLANSLKWFNEGLPEFIKREIYERKQKLLQRENLVASLGVPLRKKNSVSETFSVPSPKLKEKIIIDKPIVKDNNFKPEPALDSNTYHQILKHINDVGKNLERQPSTYRGKGEEDIRDFIIFVLDPNFEMGSAGGETFNKSGKTDISLRYDSSVVFVAECKFWKGEKGYLKTIDQLLGYLTWRDSKVAVINFVQNTEFMDVLHKIKSSTITHSNFLEELDSSDENWFNYKFHLNGDRNRILDLAVISYHLPK